MPGTDATAAAVVDLADLGLDEGGHLLLDRALDGLGPGQRLTVTGRDPALPIHLGAWCRAHGHRVVEGGATDVGRAADPAWLIRALVVEKFSLERAAAIAESLYAATIAAARPSAWDLAADVARTGIGVFRHQTARKWQRWRGTVIVDDFAVARQPRRRYRQCSDQRKE